MTQGPFWIPVQSPPAPARAVSPDSINAYEAKWFARMRIWRALALLLVLLLVIVIASHAFAQTVETNTRPAAHAAPSPTPTPDPAWIHA
jgi:hypothetical protein